MRRSVVYYVRHGLTDWNVQGRLQGQHDVPLNRKGRAQAVRCGELLRELFAHDGRGTHDCDYVSSPLVRASETMEIVRATLGLDPTGYSVDQRLAEIAFGQWEGLTLDEVLARDKDVIARRDADKWNFLPPDGESYQQVARRVGAWFDSLGRDTVVTAHGGTGRALIAHLGIVPQQEATHQPIEQGIIYVFADGRLSQYA
jgi:probable phosphoglycerate mutase